MMPELTPDIPLKKEEEKKRKKEKTESLSNLYVLQEQKKQGKIFIPLGV